MSFIKPKTTIEEGNTVILYLTVANMHAIDVLPQIKNKKGEIIENIFQTNYGALKVKNLIGEKYGSKIQLSRGWAYVLQPNPDLWTQTLPHRTQIIYTPDISMILFQLDLKPGSVVIESGTGSGSLSHFIINSIKPYGHLYTFDFHKNRVELAHEEFKVHGLEKFVTVQHRDICELGFTDELNGIADAIFLDLPAPHLAIPHARKSLKKTGGRICSFSPCIEQSQRSCELLKSYGFVDTINIEILQQEEIIKTKIVPIIELAFVKQKKSDVLQQLDLDHGQDSENKSKETRKYLTSCLPLTQPGHTGYLTFATLPPFTFLANFD